MNQVNSTLFSTPPHTRRMSAINIIRETDLIVISGKTFNIKDEIKALGGSWNAERRVWTLPLEMDVEETRKKLDIAMKTNRKTETPKAEQKQASNVHWICCEKCTVIDSRRGHTSCMDHAEWDGQSWNSFRVFGRLYTGT